MTSITEEQAEVGLSPSESILPKENATEPAPSATAQEKPASPGSGLAAMIKDNLTKDMGRDTHGRG